MQLFLPALCLACLAFFSQASTDVPMLVFPGFAWAENLAFDGLGSLWVSEAVRGELWKINLNKNSTAYEGRVYLSNGVSQFGGLQVSPSGTEIYAGVTLKDKSYALIVVPTTDRIGSFKIITQTKHQPNGLACDWDNNMMYYTDEGTNSDEGGTVHAINLTTGTESLVMSHIPGADGAWFDKASKKLFIAELVSKKILTFDTSSGVAVFEKKFIGLNETYNLLHIIDDIVLYSGCEGNAIGDSCVPRMLGADWTGKAIRLFGIDGSNVSTVCPPDGITLLEPTSVRWGAGPGFDASSIYFTEGGGIVGKETNRRVVQIKMPVGRGREVWCVYHGLGGIDLQCFVAAQYCSACCYCVQCLRMDVVIA